MAAEKTKIEMLINLKDNATKTLRNVSWAIDDMKSRLFNLKTAVGGFLALAGITNIGKDFIDNKVAVDSYRLRLEAALLSQTEANRVFEDTASLAAQLSYEYDDLMSAAVNLTGVMGNADEVKKWMPIVADLAAYSGLTITEVGDQVQRMYSAGAQSADLFQQRGVLAMLGFRAGVSYSAEETRKKLIEMWESPYSRFRDLSQKMSEQVPGMLSMIQDHYFRFSTKFMESGPFDALKESLREVIDVLDELEQDGTLDAWAEAAGMAVIDFAETATMSLAGLTDFMRDNDMVEYGIMGYLLYGKKGAIAGVITAAAGIDIGEMASRVKDGFDAYKKGYISTNEWAMADDESGPAMLKDRGYYSDKDKGVTEQVGPLQASIRELEDEKKDLQDKVDKYAKMIMKPHGWEQYAARYKSEIADIQTQIDSYERSIEYFRGDNKIETKEILNADSTTDSVKTFWNNFRQKMRDGKNKAEKEIVNDGGVIPTATVEIDTEAVRKAHLQVALAETTNLKEKIALTKELIDIEQKSLNGINQNTDTDDWQKQKLTVVNLQKDLREFEKDAAKELAKATEKEYTAKKAILELDIASAAKLAVKQSLLKTLLELEEKRLSIIDKTEDPEKYAEQVTKVRELTQSLEELNRKMLEATGSFAQGFKDGAKEYVKQTETAFQSGVTMAQETASAMESAFSDFFFDAMKGELDDLSSYLLSFANSVMKVMANIMAQQVVSGIMFGVSGGSGTASSAPSTNHTGGPVIKRHTGGIVPRINWGYLNNGEVPAVLLEDERVLSREQNKQFGDLVNYVQGGGGGNMQVVIKNETGTAVEGESSGTTFDGEKYITSVVIKNINQGGSLRNAIKGLR